MKIHKKPKRESLTLINKTTPWYWRFWYLVSNPFTYIFKGKIRL